MTRAEIISELKNYFSIEELVCNHTFGAFGKITSWQFLDTEYLETLLVLRRDIFKTSMVVNNYSYPHAGTTFTQRGFRCNICDLCKSKTLKNKIYLTSHANGAACDSDVKGLTSQQAREKIKQNIDLLPYKIRVEVGVSWLHFDIYDDGIDSKYSEFKG